MMDTMADRLERRRRELIARCAEQRGSVHLQVDRWRHALSPHELAETGFEYVKRYQWWLVGAAAAVLILKPRRIRNWLQTGTTAAAAWRSIAPLLSGAQRYFRHDKAPSGVHRLH
jgi:hypothetical protein